MVLQRFVIPYKNVKLVNTIQRKHRLIFQISKQDQPQNIIKQAKIKQGTVHIL